MKIEVEYLSIKLINENGIFAVFNFDKDSLFMINDRYFIIIDKSYSLPLFHLYYDEFGISKDEVVSTIKSYGWEICEKYGGDDNGAYQHHAVATKEKFKS